MYNSFRELCERWLRVPPEPDPPPGDEATARIFRAAPNFLKYLQILWVLRTGLILLFAGMPLLAGNVSLLVASHGRIGGAVGAIVALVSFFILAAVLGFSAISLAVLQLDFEKRWYVITDRSLRIREGVMTVREITFTFANIQNLSVTQGPIQRALGIADLKVETAGGGSGGGGRHGHEQIGPNLHTAYFRGINNAEEVKYLIAQRMRGFRDSGLGDHDDHVASPGGNLLAPPVMDALRAVLTEAKALRGAI
ncbi:MAG: PH domain-containing protein, partial [Chthoniobacteraceae bacterium]